MIIEFSEPLRNKGSYRIATTSVTNHTGYYEKEEFPISGIGLRECECYCKINLVVKQSIGSQLLPKPLKTILFISRNQQILHLSVQTAKKLDNSP